jgi:chaperonin cofactor prefoldin
MGTRLLFKETAKVTASLEQKIEVLQQRNTVLEHTIQMIGLDLRKAEQVLNNLKGGPIDV